MQYLPPYQKLRDTKRGREHLKNVRICDRSFWDWNKSWIEKYYVIWSEKVRWKQEFIYERLWSTHFTGDAMSKCIFGVNKILFSRSIEKKLVYIYNCRNLVLLPIYWYFYRHWLRYQLRLFITPKTTCPFEHPSRRQMKCSKRLDQRWRIPMI